MTTTPRTVIEFINPSDFPESVACHRAKEVRINGIPVLVEADGIDIEFGNQELTKVTLTLLPTEIHFRSADYYKEADS